MDLPHPGLCELSAVFLYRPSSQKIIWLKNGPWLKQHDVDYMGEGIFTIFDNGTIDDNNFSRIKYVGHNKVNIRGQDIIRFEIEAKSKKSRRKTFS